MTWVDNKLWKYLITGDVMEEEKQIFVLEGIADELREWANDCVFESPLEAIDACRQLILDALEEYEEQEEGNS